MHVLLPTINAEIDLLEVLSPNQIVNTFPGEDVSKTLLHKF